MQLKALDHEHACTENMLLQQRTRPLRGRWLCTGLESAGAPSVTSVESGISSASARAASVEIVGDFMPHMLGRFRVRPCASADKRDLMEIIMGARDWRNDWVKVVRAAAQQLVGTSGQGRATAFEFAGTGGSRI